MRLLYVITGLEMGGAEMQLATFARQAKKDHDIKVISISPVNKLEPIFRENGIDLTILNVKTLTGLINFIKEIKKFKPDVIHSHMIHSNILSAIIGKLFSIPTICTSHNTNEGSGLRFFTMIAVYKICKPLISHVSRHGIDVYKKYLGGDRDYRVYINPIEVEDKRVKTFETLNRNKASWVCVASLTRQKNHCRLLDSFSLYLKDYPNDMLYLIGDGVELDSIKNMISEMNMDNNIKMLGLVYDLPDKLHNYDFFILSSDWEGMPVSIVEALQVGLPVVATDCGDISTLVKNNVNGFVTPLCHSELYKAMVDMREAIESGEYFSFSQNSRSSVDKYSAESCVEYWVDVYCKLISKSI